MAKYSSGGSDRPSARIRPFRAGAKFVREHTPDLHGMMTPTVGQHLRRRICEVQHHPISPQEKLRHI